MTANQIAFAKHLEEKRHNAETERQGKTDVQSRQISAAANWWQAQTASARQSEDARHNAETERTNWFSTLEAQRANQEREAIQWWVNRATAGEAQRHNLETERLAQLNYSETERSHRAQEALTSQSTRVAQQRADTDLWRYQREHERGLASIQVANRNADASYLQAQAAWRNSGANYTNAQTRESELAESIRHNVAAENELVRHNAMSEYLTSQQQSEQQRHNAIAEANERYANYVRNQQAITERNKLPIQQQQADAATLRSKAAAHTAAANVIRSAAGVISQFMG